MALLRALVLLLGLVGAMGVNLQELFSEENMRCARCELGSDERKRLGFMHIGKTGGTTFRNVLENLFPKHNLYRCRHGCETNECASEKVNNIT